MSSENAGGAAGEPQGGSSEAAQPPAGWDRRQTEDAGRAQRVRKHQQTHTLTHTNQLWGCNSTAGGRRWEIRGEISQGNPQMCSGLKPFYTNPDLFRRAQAMSRYTHIPILIFPSALRVGISTTEEKKQLREQVRARSCCLKAIKDLGSKSASASKEELTWLESDFQGLNLQL